MQPHDSRVIKRGSLEATAPAERAEELLASARERARKIVEEAEAEAARLRAAAQGEGRSAGLAQAAAALADVAALRGKTLEELHGAVVDVALEIARRVLGREIAAAPDAVLDVASAALRAATGLGEVQLRVAPLDAPVVRAAHGRLGVLLAGGSLRVVEDPGLGRGEAIVEAAHGRVDARIEAQLDAFRKALEAGGR